MNRRELLEAVVKDPSKAKLFLPHEQKEYDALCDKLPLKKQPFLVVVDNDHYDAMCGPHQSAEYLRDTTCVTLRRSVFEAFRQGDDYATYIVAHELGHAVYQFGRREFLGTAAAAIAGVLAGGGAGLATRAAAQTALPEDKKRSAIPDMLAVPVGAAAGYAAWQSIKSRIAHEELVADRIAGKAISPLKIFRALVVEIEKDVCASGREEECKQWKREIDARAEELGLDPESSADDRLKAYGMRLAFEMHDQWQAPDFDPYYPSMSDRIREIYHTIRSPHVGALLQ